MICDAGIKRRLVNYGRPSYISKFLKRLSEVTHRHGTEGGGGESGAREKESLIFVSRTRYT